MNDPTGQDRPEHDEPESDEPESDEPESEPPSGFTEDEAPLGGGIIRRLSAGTKGMSGGFLGLDEFFAPSHHEARKEIEEQRRVGRPAPSPTDPPDLTPEPGAGPQARFHGKIVVRRPGPAPGSPPQQ